MNIHKNDNNVKHVIVMVFCTQHCIHMTFPSCDDVHCMSHCNNIKGASQAHCKKGHENKYGSSGKRRTKALSRSMNLDCFAKVEQHDFNSILKPMVKLYSPTIHMS